MSLKLGGTRSVGHALLGPPFTALCLDRIGRIKQGNPLDTETMIGPQVSAQQLAKIASYVEIGKGEGAEVLIGGGPVMSCSQRAGQAGRWQRLPAGSAADLCR